MSDALLDGVLATLPLVLLLGAIVLQVLALWRFEGAWRTAAWVPAFAMVGAIGVAVLGVLAGSNLAPIWVVLAAPLCLLWLVALWSLRGLAALLRS